MPTRTAAKPLPGPHDLEQFTRQLGVLLSSGVDILRALEVAANQSRHPRLIAIASGIAASMTDGREFSQGLSRYPAVFSPFYVQMAQQGEKEGMLGEALLTVADYLQREFAGLPAGSGEGTLLTPGAMPQHRTVAALLWVFAACAFGTAVLLMGVVVASLPPLDWLGPMVGGWIALCMAGGAAWFGRGTARMRHCSSCGRGEALTGPLIRSRSSAICSACLQTSINQLRPPEPATPPASAVGTAAAIPLEAVGPDGEASDSSRNGSQPPES